MTSHIDSTPVAVDGARILITGGRTCARVFQRVEGDETVALLGVTHRN